MPTCGVEDAGFHWTSGWGSLVVLIVGLITIGITILFNVLTLRKMDERHEATREDEYNEKVRDVATDILADLPRFATGLIDPVVAWEVVADNFANTDFDIDNAKLRASQANNDFLENAYRKLDIDLRRAIILTDSPVLKPIVIEIGNRIDEIKDHLIDIFRNNEHDKITPTIAEIDKLDEALQELSDRLYYATRDNFPFRVKEARRRKAKAEQPRTPSPPQSE